MSNEPCFIDIVDIVGSAMLNNIDLMSINVVQYRINIVSTWLTFNYPVYIVHNINIPMLYDMESTSFRHRLSCDVDNIDSTMGTVHEWDDII